VKLRKQKAWEVGNRSPSQAFRFHLFETVLYNGRTIKPWPVKPPVNETGDPAAVTLLVVMV
jgi:hypothetical protein